jgi:hypothetical protein
VPVPEHVWQHLSTLQWEHIHLNGSYHFTDITFNADFRPLREYQGARLLRPAASSVPERADEPVPVVLLVTEQRGKRQFLERIEIHDGNYLLRFLCCRSIQQVSKRFPASPNVSHGLEYSSCVWDAR